MEEGGEGDVGIENNPKQLICLHHVRIILLNLMKDFILHANIKHT